MTRTDRGPEVRAWPRIVSFLFALATAQVLAACAGVPSEPPLQTSDASQTGGETRASQQLGDAGIQPMYRELMAVDLSSAIRVAAAQNLEIRQARERVEAARGRYESSVESAAPAIAPSIAFDHLSGVNQSFTGQLVPVNFSTLNPLLLVQLLINPGQVIYDAMAAKKRLIGTEQQERFDVMETLRQTALHYYDLVLAQARISVARQALDSAHEVSRLTDLRLKAGTGLPADAARAHALFAAREEDLTGAVNAFYQASIGLTLTLHLDPTITLVPKSDQLAPVKLVTDDLGIEHMLAIAVASRPDLQSVRSFAAASGADAHSALWGGIGAQLQAGYQFGGLQSQIPGQTFDMQEQRRASASVGLNLSLATFGRVRTAKAVERQALLEAQRKLDAVRADVVASVQESATQSKLIPTAQQQVDAASEALRLARANFKVGNALLLDVLQSEDGLNDARVRYTGAVVLYNKAQVDLLAALGKLDTASLTGAGEPILIFTGNGRR